MPRAIGTGLDRGWRRVATGCCFILFALCALVLGLAIAPTLKLLSRNSGIAQQRVRRVVRVFCKGFVGVLRGLRLIDYRLIHDERLAQPGSLLLANHPSLIDALFLLAYTPDAVCIVKGRLAHHPVTRHVIQSAGFIANRNPRQVIAQACKALENGQSLIVFPEGTRSTPGEPVRLRRGGAIIALISGATVVPIRIHCEPNTLIKGDPWHRVAPRRPLFTLEIGKAIQPVAVPSLLRAARRLNRRLENYFNLS
ncbi:lysophospholipid acyltransferase family protein [Halomonas sp. GXIMD04776]|uniref:lysophospholipid acyltransferase family protein n=1 Tax=Halomonas sp. GXIMD04776 TaxID=3415605 RepID=UPI003CB40FF4